MEYTDSFHTPTFWQRFTLHHVECRVGIFATTKRYSGSLLRHHNIERTVAFTASTEFPRLNITRKTLQDMAIDLAKRQAFEHLRAADDGGNPEYSIVVDEIKPLFCDCKVW